MGNIIAFVRDSLTNMVANIGTSRDKAASTFYSMPVLSDEELLNAYRGAWLPRKIVDIPAFDSVRAWRDWQAKKAQIELIEAEEKRLNVKGKILEAKIKARLWGGAAVVIGTGDQNLTEPLDVERVGKGGLKYLTVISRRNLTAGEIDRDPASEWYGKPKVYQIKSTDGVQVDIHPSRLVVFNGAAQHDEEIVTTTYAGWGDSVLLSVVEAIKQADGTAANIASLVFEAKVNVIRTPTSCRTSVMSGTAPRSLNATHWRPRPKASTATSSSTRRRSSNRRRRASPHSQTCSCRSCSWYPARPTFRQPGCSDSRRQG